MKNYNAPEMTIVLLESEDIVLISVNDKEVGELDTVPCPEY